MWSEERDSENGFGIIGPRDLDPRCEFCERSIMGRFGLPILNYECDSCRATFNLEGESKGWEIEDVEE